MINKTQNERRIIDALYRVNNFISCVIDLHRLMELIMEESKNVLSAEASSLILYDASTNELFFEVALGEKGEAVKEIRLPLGQGIAGACALERKIVVVNDCSKDPRHFKKADEKSKFVTRNILAAPMVRNEKLIGVLEVLNKKGDELWTKEDEDLLTFFSDQAAIAIENAQLIQANLQAERLAAIGQAVAGISHYVKNILAGMKGSASLISFGLQNQDVNMISQAWPIFERSNAKINQLVQDMLAYSKTREPELEMVIVNQVLEEVIRLCEENAKKNNIQLLSELDSQIPPCFIDQNRISDAVLNLVSNAIDALAQRPEAYVKVVSKLYKDENKIEFMVEDNGCGIPESVLKKIFEPFFSTKGSKGTGLGLAVTRKVIEEHGGKITVKSQEGIGTTFIIGLPLITEKKSKED